MTIPGREYYERFETPGLYTLNINNNTRIAFALESGGGGGGGAEIGRAHV